jgi:hypothetical protein
MIDLHTIKTPRSLSAIALPTKLPLDQQSGMPGSNRSTFSTHFATRSTK